MTLSSEERLRYHRHLLLPEIGEEGQEKIKSSSVLVIGAGGLGCPARLYLAAAGVGRIGIVDDDVVDASNLQRQVLFLEDEKGRKKVEVAREKLSKQNPHIEIQSFDTSIDLSNGEELVSSFPTFSGGFSPS